LPVLEIFKHIVAFLEIMLHRWAKPEFVCALVAIPSVEKEEGQQLEDFMRNKVEGKINIT
jgi:hypothetical protein